MNDLSRFEKLKSNIENDPKNFQARREFAMLLSDYGFIEAAIKHLYYLAEIFKDDADLFFNIGICFEKLKKYNFALDAYKKAVNLAPKDADFIFNLAYCYDSLNMNDEAIKEYKRAICINNRDSNSFFCLGCVYIKKGEFDKAKNCLLRAISLNDGDYYAHFHLANVYQKMEMYDDAVKEYKKTITLSPDYSWCYYNLAQIAYIKNDFEGAISMLNTCLKKNSKDREAYKLLCELYIKTNNIKSAKETIKKMNDTLDESGDAYYLAAKIAQKEGDMIRYKTNLDLCISNDDTLTFNKKSVLMELKEI